MNQRESKLSRKIMGALRAERIFAFKTWANDHTMAGLPDIIGCVDGKFLGLEVKLPESRNEVSFKQVHVHRQITWAGGEVQVICSVSEALKVANKLRGGE